MYTKMINVQILISLMKKHNIKNIVLSAGTRHAPVARCVENDPFFKTYSIVDERSAGYFALGIARQTGEPVAIACTSSTATCNYLPAIAEAYHQNIPLLVLTGDRDPYLLGQLEDQMIDQPGMYEHFVKKTVDLPIVRYRSKYDFWYCERLVNEALLELTHHGKGPVHINFRVTGTVPEMIDDTIDELPQTKLIERISYNTKQEKWQECISELKSAKRILVICGMNNNVADIELEYMKKFFEKYNCVFSIEHMSNIKFDGALLTFMAAQTLSEAGFAETLMPDIVISLGGNFISALKGQLRANQRKFKHWSITETGEIVDCFYSLNKTFECSIEYFFKYFVENVQEDIKNNREYYTLWKEQIQKVKYIQNLEFTNMYAIENLSKKIPDNSILHLGILNSTRIMQHYELPEHIKVYSNIGTDGIDGSMSTFLGQAFSTDEQAFLVFGDLSFFYDMNSIGIRHIKNNVRIMMVNNGGGGEFHFTMGKERFAKLDEHIAASHNASAKEWVESRGFKYLSAKNKEEFNKNLEKFVNEDSDKPMFFEVFTDRDKDGKTLRELYSINKINTKSDVKAKGKQTIKRVIKKLIKI